MKCTQGGFSLLEVLVTVFVFAVGLLGLASLQTVSVQANQSAYLSSQAATLAYGMMDQWRANRRAVLGAATPPDEADWAARVAAALPGGVLLTEIDDDQVTVSITWNDARFRERADQTDVEYEAGRETTLLFTGRI